MISNSEEERIARDYIQSCHSDVILVVVDATALERNLNLVYQIMDITQNVIVCVNLLDEAKKKGISINLEELSDILGVPVVGTIARKKKTLDNLLNTIYDVCNSTIKCDPVKISKMCSYNLSDITNSNNDIQSHNATTTKINGNIESEIEDTKIITTILNTAKETANKVCTYSKKDYNRRIRQIDKILTSKTLGIPIMLLFLGIIFWLTIVGANYPSQMLSEFFAYIQDKLYILFNYINSPSWFTSILVDGMYRTLAWVISVMLPPMAIFFPLFTILEDLGYLPRIAFNLDKCFKRCCASRKTSSNHVHGFWL